MQHSAPATFYSRLFRILVVIGLVAAFLVAIVVSAFVVAATREFAAATIRENISLTAERVADEMKHGEWKRISQSGKLYPHPAGVKLVCIYSRDNILLHTWQVEGNTKNCPEVIREAGTKATLLSLRIAQPIKDKSTYLGIVYAEAILMSATDVALTTSSVFAVLICAALITCAMAAYFGARHINYLMDAVLHQIECLKGNTSECMLPPASASRETLKLFDEISSLRLHLVTSLVPRETVANLRLWYENIFSNLFLLLRHRLPADSSVLHLLNDCDLLLRINSDDSPAEPETADILKIVDEGFASARMLNPPDKQVHMVVSFNPGAARNWKLHTTYLKALVRHLLLIALARTRTGLICLRLEIVPQPNNLHSAQLVWSLEDSGPPLQPGVLRSRLAAMPHKTMSVNEASWMLAVHLAKRQGGTIAGENTDTGLLLNGEMPIGYPDYEEQVQATESFPTSRELPRLVLLVGGTSTESDTLCEMLQKLHCRVIWAADYIQALEIAPALPFSAIILNEFLYGRDNHTALKRILALMENKLMPVVSLWVVTASAADAEQRVWSAAGANEVLLAPVRQDTLSSLCARLIGFNPSFWATSDMNLLQEYSPALEARMPEMRAELAAYIQKVQAMVAAVAQASVVTPAIMHDVHAIKSMALALGYMHLARMMANLEYMLAGRKTVRALQNIAIMAACMQAIILE